MRYLNSNSPLEAANNNSQFGNDLRSYFSTRFINRSNRLSLKGTLTNPEVRKLVNKYYEGDPKKIKVIKGLRNSFQHFYDDPKLSKTGNGILTFNPNNSNLLTISHELGHANAIYRYYEKGEELDHGSYHRHIRKVLDKMKEGKRSENKYRPTKEDNFLKNELSYKAEQEAWKLAKNIPEGNPKSFKERFQRYNALNSYKYGYGKRLTMSHNLDKDIHNKIRAKTAVKALGTLGGAALGYSKYGALGAGVGAFGGYVGSKTLSNKFMAKPFEKYEKL